MYNCALSNLSKIQILIHSSYIQASLLCIERFYKLSSPLINPFSDLSHNPVTLSGVNTNDTTVIDRCKEILVKHSNADLKLLPHLHKTFAQQVNSANIDEKEIFARDAIHRERLLHPKWFTMKKFSRADTIHYVSEALEQRCRQYPNLDNEILSLILHWDGLTLDFRNDVNKFITDKYARPHIL